MAGSERLFRLTRVLRGVLLASAVTLVGMAALAVLVIYANVSDSTLTALNQVLKVISIFAGAVFAIGFGGEKGLVTGALVGILYILAGYGFYCLSDGSEADAVVLLTELAAGVIAGGVFGVTVANMRSSRRRSRA